MPSCARKGDIAFPAGDHVAWPPTSFVEGASTVFVNGIPMARTTDKHSIHCLGKSCHQPEQDTCSGTVFAENLGVARVLDQTDCEMVVGTGSNNVFVGD